MNYGKGLNIIKELVQNYYADHLNPNKLYHNLQHTRDVVACALKIAGDYKLDARSLFIIEAASWLHDIDFPENPGAQKKEIRVAENILNKVCDDDNLAKEIKACILATRMSRKPKDLLQQITCDASRFDLGSADFLLRSRLMRREYALMTGIKLSKEEWKRRDLELLQHHRFKTDIAKQLFQNQQNINLQKLLDDTGIIPSSTSEGAKAGAEVNIKNEISTQIPAVNKTEPNTAINNHDKRPDRGIETMFRISSNNHQALSQMADNKAHIMITVNSIIISVLLSVLVRSLDNEPHLTIPVAILLIVNVVTIIFSILATRPNIPSGTYSKEDSKNHKPNLLFFGNFYKMPLDDFSERMTHLMENRNYLYNSLIVNLHEQGIVLGKKYTYLRISYNVFMYGLVVSILSFGIAILINGA
jgi:predicted metal-dependent HD superfamily phosphohydrolase